MTFLRKNVTIILLLSLLSVFCCSPVGYTMTPTATTNSITIPMEQWNGLKADWTILDEELIAYKEQIQKIKKPSAELQLKLEKAEKTLMQLQEELKQQSSDLTTLSRQVDESKTELQTLKQQIDKERRVHKRQIWQSRIWCLLIGAGIGYAASR